MEEKSRDADFNALLRTLFKNEKWQDRAEAARNLGFLHDSRAVNLMCKALEKEEEFPVVNRLIEALGRIENPKATLIIIEKLMDELEKPYPNKYRLEIIIESLTKLKDKRALSYIGTFLNSEDEDLKKLAQEAFDAIEPEWREILKKEQQQKSIQEIFKKKI